MSTSGKYLVDQSGTPFVIIGDTAWSLAGQLGPTDVFTYLDDRQAKGFNAIEVNAIEHYFSTNAPNNYNNDPPFTNGPADWSVRNEAYWGHIDYIIQEAKNRGILVLLYPAYLGFECGDQGWCVQMQSQTNIAMTSYGQRLGNRYKNHRNIMWVHGGDANANSYTDAYNRVAALASGIRSADPASLHSASSSRGRSGMDDYNAILDINSIYSGGVSIDIETKREYQRTGAKPVYFYEGLYEGEGAGPLENQSQALIPILGGSLVGALFGNNPMWNFCADGFWCNGSARIASLDSPGSVSMSNIGKLIRPRRWYNLVPDYDNTVVTSTKGAGINYNATAREKTGETVMVWCPTTAQVTVNMTKISGTQASAWWWDPDDNSSSLIWAYPTTGTMNFIPISERTVLVIDDASKGLPPPGVVGKKLRPWHQLDSE